MILSDSNILSSFAAARSLPLLFTLLVVDVIFIPPAVHSELQQGLDRGRRYLADVEDLLATGKLRVVELTQQDREMMEVLPGSFGPGEREAVALCLRLSARLLSNERRVVNYCSRRGVACLDLPALLRMLWRRGIVSKAKVRTMMRRMREIEGIVFAHPSEILDENTAS